LKNGYSYAEEWNQALISHHIWNSKWITDTNLAMKTVELWHENIGEKLHDISLGDDSFAYDKQKIKAKIDKCDGIK
jgi:hypothetical protein